MAMHPGEIAIPDEVVRALVDAQFPQWRELPVRRLATAGTVNAIFRVGDGLAARLPLRDGDPGEVAASLRQEASAAAALAEHSPFPVPRPVAIGAPGPGYPLPWSVQTWLPGITATDADPGGSAAFAEDLATLITAMRQAGTQGKRFSGEGRGGHLPAHDAWMEECFRKSEGLLDVTRARALWARLRDLPDPGRDVMSHKDLIPGNLLVAGGRLAGILDTGGFGPADPALDLVAAWHLLEAGPRAVLRVRLGSDETEWERGKAWALEQAIGLPWYYADSNPPMSALGLRTLERIFAASAA
jgi:aminoglycoside phosphotransferase (APT) family kinase protein